jgi:thiopeptide-type bacteriocin biosynthesis protein
VHQLVRAERTLWPDDVVFAEIAHLPEGRVGNVVCRPHLRQYEIPFLATSALPPDRQIPLSDLTVSLRGGRIVLRSQRLRREVLPRLTSAHNFHGANNLKLYKFLCLLQEQDVTADLSWSWGACAGRPFLPRVTWGNVVFCLAQWRLAGQTAHQIFSRNNDEGQRRLRQWRIENQLPRFVFITEHDNQLLIDFESDLSIDALLDHIHKNQETLLVEMFPPPGALPVRGPEGAFVHEMVLPLQRRIPRRRGPAASSGEDSAAEAGGISTDNPISAPPIASGWLFAKLFCSPTHADRLLSELVQPLVKEMIHPWFFSRYDDPHWHLRLRFQGDPASLNNQVLPMLMSRAAPFRRQGIIWRLEFEAYESEVERYGGPQAIAVAERIFQFDSELCMDLLPFTSGDDGAQLRWQLAFCGVDRWLTALGLDLTEKNKLAASMRASREQDYIVDQTYREQIARKFRSDDPRNTLLAILSGEGTGAGQLFPEEAMSSFARFSALLEEAREQLKALERAGQLTRTIPELAVSFVHMHLNRLLRASHLAQEAVLFDFLARTYAAKLAQGRT